MLNEVVFRLIAGYVQNCGGKLMKHRLHVLVETIARNREGDTTVEVCVVGVPHVAYPIA